jgi:hypothetical protein
MHSDGWKFLAEARGTTCTDKAGAPGLCDGGPTDPEDLGTCLSYIKGDILPKYQILNVMYAPAGGGQGDADYQTGSTFGTTNSTSSTWVEGTTLSFSNGGGAGDFAAGDLNLSFSSTSTNGSGDSFDVKETTTADLNINRDAGDGVNHEFDRIYLLLNPQVNVAVNPIDTTQLTQQMTVRDGQNAKIQFVTVGQLHGTQPINQGLANDLASVGITSADYQTMLNADPFSASTPDFSRFVFLDQFPYEPVTSQTQLPTNTVFSVSSVSTAVHSSTASQAYSVSASLAGSSDFLGLMKVKLKLQFTFSYTHSNSSAQTTANTVSAKVTIPQPSFTYEGPVQVVVYLDTIYNTFMFEVQ